MLLVSCISLQTFAPQQQKAFNFGACDASISLPSSAPVSFCTLMRGSSWPELPFYCGPEAERDTSTMDASSTDTSTFSIGRIRACRTCSMAGISSAPCDVPLPIWQPLRQSVANAPPHLLLILYPRIRCIRKGRTPREPTSRGARKC